VDGTQEGGVDQQEEVDQFDQGAGMDLEFDQHAGHGLTMFDREEEEEQQQQEEEWGGGGTSSQRQQMPWPADAETLLESEDEEGDAGGWVVGPGGEGRRGTWGMLRKGKWAHYIAERGGMAGCCTCLLGAAGGGWGLQLAQISRLPPLTLPSCP
jgi:hypothetical protein